MRLCALRIGFDETNRRWHPPVGFLRKAGYAELSIRTYFVSYCFSQGSVRPHQGILKWDMSFFLRKAYPEKTGEQEKEERKGMNCSKCGQVLKEGAKFCTGCGFGKEIAPGRRLLKITGIIALVLYAISVLQQSWVFMLHFVPDMFPNEMSQAVAQVPLSTPVLLYGMLSIWFALYAAIMAIIHCGNLAKSDFLKSLGTLWIGVLVVGILVVFVFSGVKMAMAGLPFQALNFVLPTLYIVGAVKNQKASQV